jgi:cell filamentation protein, protein adenylyltransferase
MRSYEKSHPWLTFAVDLRAVGPRLWMAFGEAQSKCEHVAGVPLRPNTASELHQMYLAKGILATTAIEGNTLTEKEVRDRIDGAGKLPPSREYLGREVDNILEACNEILKQIIEGKPKEISVDLISYFNRTVLKNLELETGVEPGKLRRDVRGVGRYLGAPVNDIPYLLERLCRWLNSDDFKAPPGQEIVHGLIKAIVAHVYFVWIHPFGDGNGRTARLIEVKLLLEAGVPSAAAHLLSNYYNQTRQEYYRHLDKVSKLGGDLIPFIEYAISGFVDELKEQLDIIRNQQWDVIWRNYIHERFRDKQSPSDDRRRRLALAISQVDQPVRKSDVRRLTTRLAEDYAHKTTKTVSRDLNTLQTMNLISKAIVRTPKGTFSHIGYVANREIILAFLPVRADTRPVHDTTMLPGRAVNN